MGGRLRMCRVMHILQQVFSVIQKHCPRHHLQIFFFPPSQTKKLKRFKEENQIVIATLGPILKSQLS